MCNIVYGIYTGIQVWADGSTYEGVFKDDLRHGQGTQTWTDGSVGLLPLVMRSTVYYLLLYIFLVMRSTVYYLLLYIFFVI